MALSLSRAGRVPFSAVPLSGMLCSSRSLSIYQGPKPANPRPVSPHVQIYAFPVPAISSITNRVTGVALSVAATSMGLISVFGGDVVGTIQYFKTNLPVLMPIIKFGVGFPLVYHSIGGYRHLYWDKTAKGLDSISEVNASSYFVIGSSAVLGVALALY